ncbi:branched-chain amino acid transport system permease protein [Rhizobium petrolearium]|jgi:branched-chain amino acid transport system permease protein|uniref:Branched-chain amino acid ABC transporter permease n=2 Tax=Neorhizobium TaxID=1525371 RepID=A0ABV0MCT0_9HYPH|nr:branched-chain amino acid ABC transporter permease [Neorhizobium petrolearium]MBP1848362.1 branched-chain amino acid transport system permease protein [Neorhizobium petrolearium]MCC2614599.1 branched-chain amino acid ABC transporter permease [Neorhizobium petrolearium]WGI72355.1 branched-chain amino acid ABC transporter permease [Neorhizobium petrolearium]
MRNSKSTSNLRHDGLILLGLAIFLAILGVTLSNQFHRSIVVLSMIHAIAAIGLTLLMGYAGQVSIGQGAFMGVGAYAAAFAMQQLSLPVPVALIGAILLPGLLGYVIGRPILRLSGHNLALGTLALGAVFFVVASQWRSVTGGIDPGIVNLPNLGFWGQSHETVVYWLSAVVLLVAAIVAAALVDGRFGRGLEVLRTSEVVAACMGVDTVRAKSMVFAIAAAFAGASGALLALYLRSFNANTFGVSLSIELLMMVIIGSLSTIWGAIFGAFAIIILPNLLESFDHAKLLVYGLTMVAVMMFAPRGLGETLLRFVRSRSSS